MVMNFNFSYQWQLKYFGVQEYVMYHIKSLLKALKVNVTIEFRSFSKFSENKKKSVIEWHVSLCPDDQM